MSYICGDCHQEHKVPKHEEDEQEKVSTGSAGLACVLALIREREEYKLQLSEAKDEANRLRKEKFEAIDRWAKLADEDKEKLTTANRLNGELVEALKAFLAVDNGGWERRHAAENTYCPDCANEKDAWTDQEEHHPGCKYLARIEAAKAAISKVTPTEKRNHDWRWDPCSTGGLFVCKVCDESYCSPPWTKDALPKECVGAKTK